MRRRPSLTWPLVLLALGVVAVDQATKQWALATLTEGERISLVGEMLGLTLVFNPGAALSIATGQTWILTLAAVAVTVVVLRMSNRLGSRTWTLALGLLLGGAVGNLIDRLFRAPGPARGEVVDFIAYGDWFVGNVADIAIVVAAGLMILLGIRGVALDGTRHEDPRRTGPAGDSADAADEGDGAAGSAAAGDTAPTTTAGTTGTAPTGDAVGSDELAGDELADRR